MLTSYLLVSPAEGADAYIRNPMKQVQKLLESKHAGHYKVKLQSSHV